MGDVDRLPLTENITVELVSFNFYTFIELQICTFTNQADRYWINT